MDRNKFFYPRSRYSGEVKPENLVFNSNLQEFAQRVSVLCNLETGGKISAQETFEQIQDLWEQLETSQENLGVGQNPFHP